MKGKTMNMTYEEIVKAVVNHMYLDYGMDDFDKGELSGAAFVIAQMFGKNKVSVKNDIFKVQNQ